ncbi:hypothetical protein BVRB_2g042170 [Beta vulgaris subsp. vulgaris]|nr:hypothetical protein BVRB_2g042170 [Beta vulgaris subsp. vulgaris]
MCMHPVDPLSEGEESEGEESETKEEPPLKKGRKRKESKIVRGHGTKKIKVAALAAAEAIVASTRASSSVAKQVKNKEKEKEKTTVSTTCETDESTDEGSEQVVASESTPQPQLRTQGKDDDAPVSSPIVGTSQRDVVVVDETADVESDHEETVVEA